MPDRRVEAATDNWGPRFKPPGVGHNDFAHTTSSFEGWKDWLDAGISR